MKDIKKYTQFVVDASVVIKWLNAENEDNLLQADKVRALILDDEIDVHAPELIIYEAANALLKGKQLSVATVQEALDIFFDIGVPLHRMDRFLSKQAVDIANSLSITFYDAAYMQLAHIMDAPLISANPKHHKSQKDIMVIDIADWPV